jgi:coenzyme F420-reducing hydrogenase alpha subunit
MTVASDLNKILEEMKLDTKRFLTRIDYIEKYGHRIDEVSISLNDTSAEKKWLRDNKKTMEECVIKIADGMINQLKTMNDQDKIKVPALVEMSLKKMKEVLENKFRHAPGWQKDVRNIINEKIDEASQLAASETKQSQGKMHYIKQRIGEVARYVLKGLKAVLRKAGFMAPAFPEVKELVFEPVDNDTIRTKEAQKGLNVAKARSDSLHSQRSARRGSMSRG